MRRTVIAMLIMCMPSALFALSDAPPMPEWLSGAWSHEEGEAWSNEVWSPLQSDVMLGFSRSGNDGETLFWEHMWIVKEDDGGVAFWAVSADEKPVRFELVVSMEKEVIFENAAHDYPQRIRYWREGKQLKAEISLLDGSNAKAFSWRRAKR